MCVSYSINVFYFSSIKINSTIFIFGYIPGLIHSLKLKFVKKERKKKKSFNEKKITTNMMTRHWWNRTEPNNQKNNQKKQQNKDKTWKSNRFWNWLKILKIKKNKKLETKRTHPSNWTNLFNFFFLNSLHKWYELEW